MGGGVLIPPSLVPFRCIFGNVPGERETLQTQIPARRPREQKDDRER